MSFRLGFEKFADKAMADVKNVIVGSAKELVGSIVDDTPYVTGWTRGNWQTGAGSAPTDTIPIRAPEAVKAEAEAAAEAACETGVPIKVRNNCPHIRRLEYDGWSDQAPHGMVRKNVARWRRIVREQIRHA